MCFRSQRYKTPSSTFYFHVVVVRIGWMQFGKLWLHWCTPSLAQSWVELHWLPFPSSKHRTPRVNNASCTRFLMNGRMHWWLFPSMMAAGRQEENEFQQTWPYLNVFNVWMAQMTTAIQKQNTNDSALRAPVRKQKFLPVHCKETKLWCYTVAKQLINVVVGIGTLVLMQFSKETIPASLRIL